MIPRSIARAAMRHARAADTTPQPVRHLGELVDGRWVTESHYPEPDGTVRIERGETPARTPILNPRLACEDCGRPPLPIQRTRNCLACGGRLHLTTLRVVGPAGR